LDLATKNITLIWVDNLVISKDITQSEYAADKKTNHPSSLPTKKINFKNSIVKLIA